MIEILEPIAQIPGVRLVGLVTRDGVPVAVPGMERKGGSNDGSQVLAIDVEAAAAVATQWLSELTRTVAALTWPNPERVVLTAARGCLVLVQSPGSVLMAITDASVNQEELRLHMDGAARRIGRALRGPSTQVVEERTDPPAALPSERSGLQVNTPAQGPAGSQDPRTSAGS
ncbi:roadblock/LC7 domain-containing protein [Engelhardtia mirabilis]|uniref:Roadblock/LAMTOR2 domain-containing protein n=1 Tax=Engelhardtia mirabilis TaxID=2528011 RepID=A0A518BNR0_9BACT|nr:hypothetical protein Pla133_37230 [Planctomycetes bacterium Pla133]QDV02949.1 hypothetical protein Pla86_37220 [Planctomycetes bacterium Pla86]